MIKPSTLAFLESVMQNNNREWFAANKGEYETAKADVLALVESILPEIAKADPLISAAADPKKCMMRIYRDVRFSKNKDPYKTNFGIWFSANGKGGNEPGYYLHLQPNHSFLAGGYWMPEAAHLKLIRQEIDYNGDDFKAILQKPDFAEHFKLSTENSLKKAPKGYSPDDPQIAFLKLKSFEVVKKIPDEALYRPAVVEELAASFKLIYPLVSFLRNAIVS